MQLIRRAILAGAIALACGAGSAGAVLNNTTIYAIQQGTFAVNDSVLCDNVVVIGVDVKPGTYGVYVQEIPGGRYSGILAFTSSIFPVYSNTGDPVTLGDRLTVKGQYSEFSGLSEIVNPTFTKESSGAPLIPVKLPVDSLKVNYAGSEAWEGVLVRVDTVKVTSLNTFNDWRFHMNTGPAPGRVDSLVGYEKMVIGQVIPEVNDVLNVVGVADFAFSERRVAPRNDNDITFLTGAPAAVPLIVWSSAENKIKVKFNVALNVADAQTTSKYSLSTLQTITSAVYDAANKLVTLTTGTNMVPSVTPHVLTIQGIRNSQNVPMVGTHPLPFIGGIATIVFVQTPKSASNDSSQVANQQVTIRGVVTETTGGATPDFPASTGGFYVQQRGATQYGAIFVFGSPITPVKNDSVLVSGICTEFGVGPETELISIDETVIISNNRPPIVPPNVTVANASGNVASEGEKYEGMLIRLANVRCQTQDGPGDPFDITAFPSGVDTVHVDDLAVEESAYTPWRGDNLDVIGIVRYSGTAPFRRLQPRRWNEPPLGDIHVISKANVSDAIVPAYRTGLAQNQPNPFNPTTEIAFTLAQEGPAALRIYTVDGKRVRTLFDGKGVAGLNRYVWDGRNDQGKVQPSGVYLYRLATTDETFTRKMVLLR